MDNATPVVTIDKIIEKSKQWTLEGDCTLLQWMEQISKNLEERVTRTTSALNAMSTNLDRTSVALSNATNNLAALQYSQFVENRVHDDDETLANVAEVPNPSSDETDNKVAKDNIYSFLKKNLEMMNSCHEAYSINYDDSDEDEPSTNVVYRSKNPYEARSLPHIYGSTLWKEKWHIGLCDSDNDFSGDENSEQFSESSSTADDSYESTAPTMSEWDSTAWGLNTNHLVEAKEAHTPSNDGESSCQGEIYSQSEVSTPRPHLPTMQPVQDQRYYQHIPRRDEGLFDDIFTDAQHPVAQTPPQIVSVPPKKIDHGNLLPTEPPPIPQPVDSDNSRRVGARKPVNLFDDNDFSSFMDEIVQTATNKNKNGGKTFEAKQETPQRRVAPNLFDDTEDRLSPKVIQSSKQLPQEPPKKTVVPNLFEDSEDEFIPPIPAARKTQDKPPESSKRKEIPNLFDDSEDLFTPKATEQSVVGQKELPPKLEDDIFMPPPVKAIVAKTKITNLFDDDDEDDDFENIFAKPTTGTRFSEQTKNLFEDEPALKPVITPKQTPIETKQVKEATVKQIASIGKGLFDDDDEDLVKEDDIFRSNPVKKNPLEDILSKENVLKSPDSVKNDLFSDKAPPENAPREEIKTKGQENETPTFSALKTDLFSDAFNDEPPDDIFAPSTSYKSKVQVADIFADDFTDDFDEFIPKEATKKLEQETPQSSDDKVAPNLPDIARKPTIHEEQEQETPELEKISKKEQDPVEGSLKEELPPSELTALQSVKTTTGLKYTETTEPESSLEAKNEVSDKLTETVKQFTVPSYADLFQDEPPPDDDIPSQPSNEASPIYSAQASDKTSPVVPYSSVNLFADVPPDDDFLIAPPVEPKRIHSVFYDDFNETIEASREMRAPSSYIFNDEPPPDDEPQSPKAVVAEKSPKIPEDNKNSDKPKVSKLKKIDLKINVDALLPSAKIPSFKKPIGYVQPLNDPPRNDDNIPRVETTPKPTEKRVLPENILPNLNRDRARVQVKRRPSTRKGRQESYRKSIIEDETLPSEEEQNEAGSNATDEKKKSLFEDFGTFDVKKIIPEGKVSTEESFPSTTNFQRKPQVGSSKVSASSEGRNIFETIRSDMPPDLPKPNKANDSLFDSDVDDENPFGSPTKLSTEPAARPPLNVQAAKSTSLFEESDDEKQPANVAPQKNARKTFEEPSPKSSSLFEESENEKQPVNVAPKKNALKPLEEPSPKSSSLFGESDDGSDDLFKATNIPKKSVPQKTLEKKSKPKALIKPAKPAASLFSSDEDTASGDDIFGKPKTKIAGKKTQSAKVKPSSSLFADISDEDDDDLFGSTKKKPSGGDKTRKSTTTSQPAKTSAQAQPHTAVSNNPLSDLLGP